MDDQLVQCVRENNSVELLRLLKSGVDPNLRDENGQTPLMLATTEDHEEIKDTVG